MQLQQLGDSACPIGATAHSFGLETLVAEEVVTVERLEAFLRDYLEENMGLESACCRLAHRLSVDLCSGKGGEEAFLAGWRTLNEQLSALKPARESRLASATLGRRFLQLSVTLTEHPHLHQAFQAARKHSIDMHYSSAFGLVGGMLAIAETAMVLAYLQQTLAGLVSACQRLLPLGQSLASLMQWRLKPVVIQVAESSQELAQHPENITFFTPLVDLGSMRHPQLTTRLFVS